MLAGWQEAAQQPILIKRGFILPDEPPNLVEISESAPQGRFISRSDQVQRYILEVLNLEDIPSAYAFAIEKIHPTPGAQVNKVE